MLAKRKMKVGGGTTANTERGPIKVKAKGSMNDLVLKHTWGHPRSYATQTAAIMSSLV